MATLADILSNTYFPHVVRCPGDYAKAIRVRHVGGQEYQAILECKSGHTIAQDFSVPDTLPVCDAVVASLTAMLFRGTALIDAAIDAALKKHIPGKPEVVH